MLSNLYVHVPSHSPPPQIFMTLADAWIGMLPPRSSRPRPMTGATSIFIITQAQLIISQIDVDLMIACLLGCDDTQFN